MAFHAYMVLAFSVSSFCVGIVVDARHGTAAGVVDAAERGVPGEGFGGGACHARHARHAASRTVGREISFKDGAVVIFFLVLRRVDGESFCRMRHLLVGDGCRSHFFEGVDPTVAHSVGKLLFLSPSNALWEHVGKGFADYALLDGFSKIYILKHLFLKYFLYICGVNICAGKF